MDLEDDDDDRCIDDRCTADDGDAVPTVSPHRRSRSSEGAATSTSTSTSGAFPLTDEQIRTFVTDGVLVVPNVLTPAQLSDARSGLHSTLRHHGVDPNNLLDTGHNLSKLSSTDGSGGVLDVFYPRWKMELSTNETLFGITTQLWEAGYCHRGETEEEMLAGDGEEDGDDGEEEYFKYHPHGPFDTTKGYAYLDRIGYRLPTRLSEELGRRRKHERQEEEQQREQIVIGKDPELANGNGGNSKNDNGGRKKDHGKDRKAERASKWNDAKKKKQWSKKKSTRPLQRSLTPHLDVCPQTLHSTSGKQKWRPIQCLISLVDTLEPNMGGFEAAIDPGGFHRSFHRWTRTRKPSISREGEIEPPPCVGEYTPLRPREDADVMSRIGHVPVMAGGAIFWDNRVPHGNAYRHDGDGDGGEDEDGLVGCGYGTPRAVAYCSFLPDVEINRRYVRRQLEDWTMRRKPRDRWIEIDEGDGDVGGGGRAGARDVEEDEDGGEEGGAEGAEYEFSELGRKLMGIDAW